MKARHYPSLDGLRGVAALMVLIGHTVPPFMRNGGVGVDIFFTLSGFLITSILLTERDAYGSIGIKNFYARRFLRLMPCLWMTVAAYLVYSWLSKPGVTGVLEDSVYALVYVMNWVKAYGHDGGALGHTWSLAIEEQYYVVWPVVLITLISPGQPRYLQGWLLVLAAIMVAVYRASIVGTFSAYRIHFGLDTHSDGLLIGSAVAFFVGGSRSGCLSITWSRVTSYLIAPCAVLGVVAVTASWTWKDPAMGLFGFTAVSACSAIIIFDLVAGSHSLLRWALTFGPLVWIGKVSYGLYLWHIPIYDAVNRLDFVWSWERRLLLGGTLSVLVSAMSYYLVERRCLLLKTRFSRTTVADVPGEEGTAAKGAAYEAV